MEASGRKKTNDFIKEGSVLAAASILVRIIGLIYRIPMNNIIGDEGNGIYSAAFEIYNILLIISSYGMPMAVSKMVSTKCAQKRYRNAYYIFRCSMLFSIITGGAAALFVYFGADMLEKRFFSKYQGIAIPLRILAPTILIVAVMGVFRGLYQGRRTMMPTAFSQVLEQVVNAIVSVAAAYMLMRSHSASPKISAWGAAGGTLGTFFGAAAAFVVLFVIYLLYRPTMRRQIKRDRLSSRENMAMTYRLIFSTVIPIILSQTVYQLSGIIDVTLFNALMDGKGHSGTTVSTQLGIYSTKYRTLTNVPIAISTAMASSMVPGLVSSYMRQNLKEVRSKISVVIKFNMMIAFPSAMGLAVLAEPIIRLLFRNSDYRTGATMLMTGSLCVVFYALSTVTNGVLQSIDKMNHPVYHSLISLVIHIILVALLLKFTNLGAYALVIGNVTYPLLVCILNGRSVSKSLGYRQEITKTFCIPLLASFFMGIVTFAVYQGLFMLTHRIYVAIIPAILMAVAIYFVLVLKLGGLSRTELYEFPMGRRMSVLADRLKLLRDS